MTSSHVYAASLPGHDWVLDHKHSEVLVRVLRSLRTRPKNLSPL